MHAHARCLSTTVHPVFHRFPGVLLRRPVRVLAKVIGLGSLLQPGLQNFEIGQTIVQHGRVGQHIKNTRTCEVRVYRMRAPDRCPRSSSKKLPSLRQLPHNRSSVVCRTGIAYPIIRGPPPSTQNALLCHNCYPRSKSNLIPGKGHKVRCPCLLCSGPITQDLICPRKTHKHGKFHVHSRLARAWPCDSPGLCHGPRPMTGQNAATGIVSVALVSFCGPFLVHHRSAVLDRKI